MNNQIRELLDSEVTVVAGGFDLPPVTLIVLPVFRPPPPGPWIDLRPVPNPWVVITPGRF